MFSISWTASIFAATIAWPSVNVVDFDRAHEPFKTQRECIAYGYRSAPMMAELISAYFGEADVSVKWKCGPATKPAR